MNQILVVLGAGGIRPFLIPRKKKLAELSNCNKIPKISVLYHHLITPPLAIVESQIHTDGLY